MTEVRKLVQQYGPTCLWRCFDEHGVALVDYGGELGRQYNPVTISQVAIGCFHKYRADNSARCRDIYLDQIAWLKAHAVFDDADGAAYEYAFPWNYGLQPGWRSGLAQGQAISALIRYYYDTADASVLELIRKLKNAMMRPFAEGGLVTVSPEGGPWIEEYPSDPPSLVLNGFVSAVFGLYEYTRLFGDDREAKFQFEQCIDSIKVSLPYYDSGSWMYLDRRQEPKPKPEANDSYAETYISQMETLFDITGDPLFLKTKLRWHSFFGDVNVNALGNMRSDAQGHFSLAKTLWFHGFENRLIDNYEIVRATESLPGYGIDQLFDESDQTYYAPAVEGPTEIHLKLNRPTEVNLLKLGLYNADLYPGRVRLELRGEGEAGLQCVKYDRVVWRRGLYYRFAPVRAVEIRILADRFVGQQRLVISELSLGNYAEAPLEITPGYGSHVTDPVSIPGRRFGFGLKSPAASQSEIFILCRYADCLDGVAEAPWQWDCADPFSPGIETAQGRFCQFKLLCTPAAGMRGWSDLSIKAAPKAFGGALGRWAVSGRQLRVA